MPNRKRLQLNAKVRYPFLDWYINTFDETLPAMLNGYTLNAAIGMQVVLGALVTGLSSALAPGKVGYSSHYPHCS